MWYQTLYGHPSSISLPLYNIQPQYEPRGQQIEQKHKAVQTTERQETKKLAKVGQGTNHLLAHIQCFHLAVMLNTWSVNVWIFDTSLSTNNQYHRKSQLNCLASSLPRVLVSPDTFVVSMISVGYSKVCTYFEQVTFPHLHVNLIKIHLFFIASEHPGRH